MSPRILNWLRDRGHVEQVRRGWWRTTGEIAEYVENLFDEELTCETGVRAIGGEPGRYDPERDYEDPAESIDPGTAQRTIDGGEYLLPEEFWSPYANAEVEQARESGREGGLKAHQDPEDIPPGQLTIDDLTDDEE
ncbi:hypothetical protein [Natrialbaceae archaeon AArc-T1-2]|uniref:hypothetical protein n=1 Tax=Natrialbaceae archaeon AArc-T1-2 TaxID=3053904 RepID=UPI00255AA787|nr:hypothetical protein [Natrialbaceae archaeon AArc-T1-2]WIV66557.1 hypothetical protein QQ977_12770 [Natrialbaceae archaeon AArc-T1-2]